MPLLRRRSADPEDRALTRANVPAMMLGAGEPGSTPAVSAQAALRVADVYACVRLVAGTIATLPLKTYRRLADGEREPYTGRLAGLLDRPTPTGTSAGLLGQIGVHLLTRGNAFIGLFRDDSGQVAQLACLPPESVVVKVEGGETVYDYMSRDGVGRLTRRDVCHVRHPVSDDGVLGLSPLQQAAAAIGLNRDLVGHGAAFARNAARPSGVLAVKSGASDPGTREMLRDLAWSKAGGEGSGGILVLGSDEIDWKPFSLSHAEAEYVESVALSTAAVARAFGVPPEMIGAKSGDSMTYANIETRTLALRQTALAPLTTAIEQAITGHPELSPRSVFCEFLYDGLLRPDSATRASVYAQALDPERGWMTRGEVRRLENLPAEASEPSL